MGRHYTPGTGLTSAGRPADTDVGRNYMVESRDRWLAAAKAVVEGSLTGYRCPENDDADLRSEWIPFSDGGGGGEYRVYCPSCGAENYVLVRKERSAAEQEQPPPPLSPR